MRLGSKPLLNVMISIGIYGGYNWWDMALADSSVPVDSPVQQIFVPSGFDSNDNVEVVLFGEYPNTCYRAGHASAETANGTITIKATSYEDLQDTCTQMLSPFIQPVKLGKLQPGVYELIYDNGEFEIREVLHVKNHINEHSSENLYAPVEFADIYKDRETGETKLLLYGQYPRMLRGCAEFKEIKVHQESGDMIVVYPILDFFDDSTCEEQPLSFNIVRTIPDLYGDGALVHVRIISGDSFNRYVEFSK